MVLNITFLKIFLFLMSCSLSNGQSHVERAYYDMIKKTMSKDTVVDALTEKSIKGKMETGRMTKEDSIKYYNIIKTRKPVLYKFHNNSLLRKVLADDSREYKIVASRISEKTVETAFDNIPPKDDSFEAEKVGNNIELVDKFPESKICHGFSSPIDIDENQFLVYHSRAGETKYDCMTEIIIFSVRPDGSYIIDENILLSLY